MADVKNIKVFKVKAPEVVYKLRFEGLREEKVKFRVVFSRGPLFQILRHLLLSSFVYV